MLSHWISSAQRKFARKSIASVVHVLGILLTYITQNRPRRIKSNLMPQATGLDRSTKSRHHKQKDVAQKTMTQEGEKFKSYMPQAAGLDGSTKSRQHKQKDVRPILQTIVSGCYIPAVGGILGATWIEP